MPYFDMQEREDGIIYMRIQGHVSVKDTEDAQRWLFEIMERSAEPRYVLVGTRHLGMIDADAVKMIARELGNQPRLGAIALVGSSAYLRNLFNTAVEIAGDTGRASVFLTENEALEWLYERRDCNLLASEEHHESTEKTMNAEIITIGTELLLGETVDTNSAYIAKRLAEIGCDVYYTTTVGDNRARIANAVRRALERADVVITTGGLGPTVDDKTREGVAEATERELVFQPELLEHIKSLFARWSAPFSESNRRQAYVPRGAQVIKNALGTAPAFMVETTEGTVISLPGVPREMMRLMENSVLPLLKKRMDSPAVIKSKVLRTCGVGESQVGSLIADLMHSHNPTIGTSAHVGQTDVRITAKARDEATAEALIAEMESKLRERLGVHIYGVEQESIEEMTARELAARQLRIAIVESNTAGQIAARLASKPAGAQALAYTEVISAENLTRGELNKDMAVEIAQRIKQVEMVDLCLVVLGDSDMESSPYDEEYVGTLAALATATGVKAQTLRYGGSSDLAQQWLAARALDWVRRVVVSDEESVTFGREDAG